MVISFPNMDRLKSAFAAQNIHLPDQMLRNMHQEFARTNININQAVEFWKNADLKQWCTANVPACSILKQVVKSSPNKSVKTSGNSSAISQPLVLQIKCLRDVSRPAYQQLQAVIRRNDQNALVDAANEVAGNQPKANENGRRVLHITLTDGVDEIVAMEYYPIPSLSTETPPGTKIRLLPPITLSRGTLVLSTKNVQIIGGRVAQLVETFAQKYVLASVINADLAKLEKAVPPCPPPLNAPPATQQAANHQFQQPPNFPPPQNQHQNYQHNAVVHPFQQQQNDDDALFADDLEGDALLASIDIPGWDDPNEDDLLSQAIDAHESSVVTID